MYGDASQSASDSIVHHPPLPSPPAAREAEVTTPMPEPEADAPPNAPEPDAQAPRPDTPPLSAPDAPPAPAPTLHAAPTKALEPASREDEATPLARAKSLQVPSAPVEARPVRARSLLLASLQRADERSRTPPPALAPAPAESPAPAPTPPPAARPPLANVENHAPAPAMAPTSGLRARAQKYLQTVEKTSSDSHASGPSPADASSAAENQPPKPMYPPSALSESLRRRMAHFESAK